MDAGPLPGELSARVCAGRHLSEYLVLQITGARCGRAADADPRDRAGAPAVRLHAHLDHAATRRVARTTRSACTASIASRACRCACARAARSGLSLHRGVVPPASGRESAVEHGLRARPARDRPGVSGLDGDRSVESRECADGGQRRAHRPERRRCARGVVRASPAAEGDHRRSRHRIHVQSARRMGVPTRASPWTSFGPESPWRTRLSRASTAVFATNV